MAGLIIWAFCSGVVIVGLLWKILRMKRDIYDFTGQLECWLDCMVSGKEFQAGEETLDTLNGKIGSKIRQINHIWNRKSQEMLQDKKMIQELVSDISHQTKTPIANMKVYQEILCQEPLSEMGKEFLDRLGGQTEKMDFLLQSMVKMSRMETGIIRIQKKDTALFGTLGRAVSMVVPKAEEKRIQLSVECLEDIKVSHDGKWTEEAVFNLLDNAVKYTDMDGRIQIMVTVQEMFTRISIVDSGKGIAVERQAAIFTRFYREPEVHDREGIGIGLYLARKIIELQNGYIEVHSEVGEGSDFRIYLPNEP